MTKEEKIKLVKHILLTHGIRIEIDGCGCCASPIVSFEYNGKKILDDEGDCIINMFDS